MNRYFLFICGHKVQIWGQKSLSWPLYIHPGEIISEFGGLFIYRYSFMADPNSALILF
jgi:hypothetical protein